MEIFKYDENFIDGWSKLYFYKFKRIVYDRNTEKRFDFSIAGRLIDVTDFIHASGRSFLWPDSFGDRKDLIIIDKQHLYLFKNASHIPAILDLYYHHKVPVETIAKLFSIAS